MTAAQPAAAVPPWVTRVTVVAVSIVAAVAAVASYVHIHDLAKQAGEGWRAILLPFSVDGLLTASSMVLYVRRRRGEPAGALPWIGMTLGLVASLGANLASVKEGSPVIDYVVSTWPPLALAVAFELLIMVTRSDDDTPASDAVDATEGSSAEPVARTVEDAVTAAADRPRAAAKPRSKPRRQVAGHNQPKVNPKEWAETEWANGNRVNGGAIKLATGCSHAHAYRIAKELRDEEASA